MDDRELLKIAADQWGVYHRTDWKGKLDLLRHSFSMRIDRTDDLYEYLHIILDERTKRDFCVLRPAGNSNDSSVRAFVRFVFELKSGETKLFSWSAPQGEKAWILSRYHWSLYVEAPEIGEGFFIRYTVFRDECLAACEKIYGWGYKADIRRIEVPVEDFEFLQTLDVEDEYELVRYLDDDQSFETTDVDRLLAFIDEHRLAEAVLEYADQERIDCFNDLYKAIQYYTAEQKRLRRARIVYPAAGIQFSRLKDNWEECDFFYDVSVGQNDRHDEVYRRYGDLPDGRHFGAYIWPKSEAWPDTSIMMIIGENEEMQVNTVIDGRWDARNADRWPLAAAAGPAGKSIVWLKDGELWAWRADSRGNGFLPDDGFCLTNRIGGFPVRDAVMRNDGILVLTLDSEEKKVFAYLCDEDIILVRWENIWIPANETEASRARGRLSYWPGPFAVMICKEDDAYGYYECGIRRVCFEPGLEVIKAGMLAENPALKSVTIPASVKEVQSWAFGCCSHLKNLVIEGDLSRISDWAEDAFDNCPCEEYYLRLRKNHELYLRQKELLDRFLSTGAISRAQHDKSLHDLREKMGER